MRVLTHDEAAISMGWSGARSARKSRNPAGAAAGSLHDQVLSGQSYRGCGFRAELAYARTLTELAGKVGRRLAAAGVIGRCAVDFVAVRGPSKRSF